MRTVKFYRINQGHQGQNNQGLRWHMWRCRRRVASASRTAYCRSLGSGTWEIEGMGNGPANSSNVSTPAASHPITSFHGSFLLSAQSVSRLVVSLLSRLDDLVYRDLSCLSWISGKGLGMDLCFLQSHLEHGPVWRWVLPRGAW